MRLLNLKQVHDFEVEKWLLKNIPELTKYQKECISDQEIIRFAPFQFYKRSESKSNIWWRLSFILLVPVFFILVLGLPFRFLLTGVWGYDKIEWYSKWCNKIGLNL